MILDSCAQQRTYERFFGLLGQRFCLLKKEYIECFEKVFQDQYEIVHRLENVKLRNVAKFFAHLLVTDAISWGVRSGFASLEISIDRLFFFLVGYPLYSIDRR
jgi:pre-mRNA-splicing factor CWC22